MNKFVNVIVTTLLVISLFINNACATSSWGVDENGKYSFRRLSLIVKEEYINQPEMLIDHLQNTYPIEKAEITSENGSFSNENHLIIGLTMQDLDEARFSATFEALSRDEYVEKVFKDYYMTPNESYLGDIDQDGKITTDDARTILRVAAGLTTIRTETEMHLADANQDGIITIEDAVHVLKTCCKI